MAEMLGISELLFTILGGLCIVSFNRVLLWPGMLLIVLGAMVRIFR